MKWMIYGANGYTGEMIAREAKARGLSPILAGRSVGKIAPLAEELGLNYCSFSLDDTAAVDRALAGVGLVLHCAGPFSQTSASMIEGCLRNKAHYLDISGEISVFEHAHTQHQRATRADVVVCPGVGFDVIPTDCVALALKEALPDATHLTLGFQQPAVLSPGTAKTTIEFIGNGGRVRRHGKVVPVALGYAPRRIDFGQGMTSAMTIPWGDIATAYFTTGIPNIKVYVPASTPEIIAAKAANLIRPILRMTSVISALQRLVEKHVKGPDVAMRDRMPTYVWGEASNARGEKVTARIKTANGYSLTITGSLAVVQYLLQNQVAGGAYTPSLLMGSALVVGLPESGQMVITR